MEYVIFLHLYPHSIIMKARHVQNTACFHIDLFCAFGRFKYHNFLATRHQCDSVTKTH